LQVTLLLDYLIILNYTGEVVSYSKVNVKNEVGKNVEGSSHGSFKFTIPVLDWKDGEKP
jgi:hypothetical protein